MFIEKIETFGNNPFTNPEDVVVWCCEPWGGEEQQVNVVPPERDRKPGQWGVIPWTGHPWWCRGWNPTWSLCCASQEMLTSFISSPGHCGFQGSAPLLMSNTHIYLHIFTGGSRDTPWLVDETTSLEFLQEKCLISMENTNFQWGRSCLFLSAGEKVGKVLGSLVSPSPGDTLGLFCCVLHGYQTPDVFSPGCGFRVRLQAGLRAHTKAGWSVNNIPLFHRCAENPAPEVQTWGTKAAFSWSKKIREWGFKREKLSVSAEIQ